MLILDASAVQTATPRHRPQMLQGAATRYRVLSLNRLYPELTREEIAALCGITPHWVEDILAAFGKSAARSTHEEVAPVDRMIV